MKLLALTADTGEVYDLAITPRWANIVKMARTGTAHIMKGNPEIDSFFLQDKDGNQHVMGCEDVLAEDERIRASLLCRTMTALKTATFMIEPFITEIAAVTGKSAPYQLRALHELYNEIKESTETF